MWRGTKNQGEEKPEEELSHPGHDRKGLQAASMSSASQEKHSLASLATLRSVTRSFHLSQCIAMLSLFHSTSLQPLPQQMRQDDFFPRGAWLSGPDIPI